MPSSNRRNSQGRSPSGRSSSSSGTSGLSTVMRCPGPKRRRRLSSARISWYPVKARQTWMRSSTARGGCPRWRASRASRYTSRTPPQSSTTCGPSRKAHCVNPRWASVSTLRSPSSTRTVAGGAERAACAPRAPCTPRDARCPCDSGLSPRRAARRGSVDVCSCMRYIGFPCWKYGWNPMLRRFFYVKRLYTFFAKQAREKKRLPSTRILRKNTGIFRGNRIPHTQRP